MQIAVLGIDLGKNSCSIVRLDASGAVVLRRRMRREGIIKLAAKLKRCVVAMEACCGAHHLGRVLRAQGHEVRGNETDDAVCRVKERGAARHADLAPG